MFTLGLWVPNWAKAKYPNDPAVGRFESKRFDAAKWVAEYPNPAFSNRLPDDGFWAAKQVMAFTDEQIRAIVAAGEYSRQESADWIANALSERRNKVGRTFFAMVLPLDRFSIAGDKLKFEDLAVTHKFRAERPIQLTWSIFDNDTEQKKSLPASESIPAGAVPAVREWMLPFQRGCAEFGDLVMDGRDIGTRIFRETPFKFFLTADETIRHRRLECAGYGGDQARRDELDKDLNLPAADAEIIDTSQHKVEDTLQELLKNLHQRAPAVFG